MKSRSTINKIKTLLGMEINLASEVLKNGGKIEAEAFEAGMEVFIVQDEEKVPLPVGDHELEDGRILVIKEEGIIEEIKEVEMESEEAEEEVPAEEEEMTEEVEAQEEEEVVEEDITEEEAEFVTKKEFMDAISDLKELIMQLHPEGLPEEVVEEEVEMSEETEEEVEEVNLSAQEEEVKPITHSPEAIVEKKDVINFGGHQIDTTKNRVMNAIFSVKNKRK